MIGRAQPNRTAAMQASRERTAPGTADASHDSGFGPIDLPPTARQIKLALGASAAIVLTVAIVVPFAATPLPRFAAFIPFLNATILVTDLVTAILLFAQFSISRSRAFLALAGGYVFTGLMAIPHALAFPGAFSPTGLLGAGLQTTAWLYVFWHLGFPTALLAYVWLKDRETIVQGSIGSAVAWCIAIAGTLVLGLAWLATAGSPFLPTLFLSRSDMTRLGIYIPFFDLSLCVLALASLWMRRRSVLDLWLMVAACALIGELTVTVTVVRFSLGFYVSRTLSLATSTIVLAMLLAETTRLYVRLAHANLMLRREQENRLTNIEAVVASISHEVKQPLSAIVMRSSTALRFLGHAPPDVEKVRSALKKIASDGLRASQIFDNIRDLFRATDQRRLPINVNELILSALDSLQGELTEHHVATRTELMHEPPLVMGHRGQMHEVLVNLIHNAIEAMEGAEVGIRELRLRTETRNHDEAVISVMDTGPGIDPEKLGSIFDAFVTTKPRGIGLGLAICRMIVERHGGQLLASSASQGGARLQVILPVKPRSGSLAPREPLDGKRTQAHPH